MDKSQSNIDNYLCAIITLEYRLGRVFLKDIVDELTVQPSSVKFNLKLLLENDLIEFDIENKIMLTQTGRDRAQKVYDCRLFLENIFLKAGVFPKTAKDDAKNIEQVMSEETYRKLFDYFKGKARD